MRYKPVIERMLTSREVRDMFRVSQVTLWRWCRDGKISADLIVRTPGNQLRFRADGIEELLKIQAEQAP